MRERYLVDFCWGNALCYRMDGLESNPIFIASHQTPYDSYSLIKDFFLFFLLIIGPFHSQSSLQA